MIDYVGMLKEFHDKYGHYIHSNIPTNQDEIPFEVKVLRYKLIDEEVNDELLNQIMPTHLEEYNIELLADALADSLYVIFGTALAFGIPIDEVFTEIHRSNMTKSMLKDEKSIKGKTIKGPDYDPPRLKNILSK